MLQADTIRMCTATGFWLSLCAFIMLFGSGILTYTTTSFSLDERIRMKYLYDGKLLMNLSIPFFFLTLVFGTVYMFSPTPEVVTAYLANIPK